MPGDEGSRYLEGGQSFPGISTSDAGKHDRDVTAAYVDCRDRAARKAASRHRRPLRGLQRLRRHHRRQAQRRATRSPTRSRCAARRARASARRRWPSLTTRRPTWVRPRRSCRCRRTRRPRRCSGSARDCSRRSRPTTRWASCSAARRAMVADVRPVPGGGAQPHRRPPARSTAPSTASCSRRPSSTPSSPTATCSIRRGHRERRYGHQPVHQRRDHARRGRRS